jgi:hypothetical protein
MLSENMEMQKYIDKKSKQKQKLLEESSPRMSEKSSKSSMRKTPGKPPLNLSRGKDKKELRADIISRMGLTSEDFKKIPNID